MAPSESGSVRRTFPEESCELADSPVSQAKSPAQLDSTSEDFGRAYVDFAHLRARSTPPIGNVTEGPDSRSGRRAIGYLPSSETEPSGAGLGSSPTRGGDRGLEEGFGDSQPSAGYRQSIGSPPVSRSRGCDLRVTHDLCGTRPWLTLIRRSPEPPDRARAHGVEPGDQVERVDREGRRHVPVSGRDSPPDGTPASTRGAPMLTPSCRKRSSRSSLTNTPGSSRPRPARCRCRGTGSKNEEQEHE
jgi:hypothetical protein